MTTNEAIARLLQLVDQAAAKGNDWPGLPLGHVALEQTSIVADAVALGLVAIVERPAKVNPARMAKFVVRVG